MSELWCRFQASPFIFTELLLASLFANLLALASPLFVIQILHRYVSSQVNSTLVTLTSGVIVAIILEFGFRKARLKLAEEVSEKRNHDLMIGTLGTLITAKKQGFEKLPLGHRQEIMKGLDIVVAAYSAPNIAALLDLPFAVLFLGVLFLLSPALGAIVLFFIITLLLMGFVHQFHLHKQTIDLSTIAAFGNSLTATANHVADTLRSFGGKGPLMKQWNRYTQAILSKKQTIAGQQGLLQTLTGSGQAFMSVAVYTVGAILVVKGELDVGTLVGANILAARALGPIVQYSRLGAAITRAKQSLAVIYDLSKLDIEQDKGVTPKHYQGALKFKDVSFAYPDVPSPLFESLDLELAPGAILMIVGANGTGKSTLIQLVAGLLGPNRGQILVDGIDLQQISMSWWRKQIIYLPQEPLFLPFSIRENLLVAAPDLDDSRIEQVIEDAGLKKFMDESSKGLDTILINNGRNLALGLRRRLAMARALATDGALVMFDEPTEGVDVEGKAAVLTVLKSLSEQGKTIVIVTDDSTILRGASLILDLNYKPSPTIHTLSVSNNPALSKDLL